MQEDYIKIGLRRLNICKEYKGDKLERELKSYEKIRYRTNNLFEA